MSFDKEDVEGEEKMNRRMIAWAVNVQGLTTEGLT